MTAPQPPASPRFHDASLQIGTVPIQRSDLYVVFDTLQDSGVDMADIFVGLLTLASEGRHRVNVVLGQLGEHEEESDYIISFRTACTMLIESVNEQIGEGQVNLSDLTFENVSDLCLHYGRWAARREEVHEGAGILLIILALRLGELEDGDVAGLIQATRAIGMRQLMASIRTLNDELDHEPSTLTELMIQVARLTGSMVATPEDLIDALGTVQVDRLLKANETLARQEFEQHVGEMGLGERVEALEDPQIEIESIQDVVDDTRWFRVDGLDTPVRLTRALTHQFYSLVARKRWWEALDLVHLSQEGCYRIAYRENQDGSLELLAAIRTQRVREDDPENNLAPTPLFTHVNWKIDFDPLILTRVIQAISKDFPHLTEHIDLGRLVENPGGIQELMKNLISILGEDFMVEKIRLTRGDIDSQDYASALIRMGDQLTEEAILAGIVITETPYLKMFQKLGFLIGRPCIVPLASYRMRPQDKHDTHQVLFFYPNVDLLKNFMAFVQQLKASSTTSKKS